MIVSHIMALLDQLNCLTKFAVLKFILLLTVHAQMKDIEKFKLNK